MHLPMMFSLAKPVFERQFRSVNAFSVLLAMFSLGKSVTAFVSVHFSPGYHVFAIWTRLHSIIMFSLGKRVFDFVFGQ